MTSEEKEQIVSQIADLKSRSGIADLEAASQEANTAKILWYKAIDEQQLTQDNLNSASERSSAAGQEWKQACDKLRTQQQRFSTILSRIKSLERQLREEGE